jgi:putative acetyltransferase
LTDMREAAASITIRTERLADATAVFDVEAAAFGRPDEARIVDAIRGTPDEVASLVAMEGDRLVAHVLFSRVRIDGLSRASAAALGPVAVVPDRQGLGIGDALIRRGIDVVRARAAFDLLFVLGSPHYYGRFGFLPADAAGFEYAPGTERAFQYMRLRLWPDGGGRVVYHAAFGG